MAKAQHAQRYRRLPGMLREMREAAALTQRDLAEKMMVTHVAVHKSETGERRVDVTEFVDWCIACGTIPETGTSRIDRKSSWMMFQADAWNVPAEPS